MKCKCGADITGQNVKVEFVNDQGVELLAECTQCRKSFSIFIEACELMED